MSEDVTVYLGQLGLRVERAIDRLVCNGDSAFSPRPTMALTARLFDAMRYALLGGGKRLRPALMYATYESLAGEATDSLAGSLDQLATALECLHGYSLIHDDLPAMDDDALRRGKPSCHIAFDEATAILAGDALQALGFELVAECPGLAEPTRLDMIRSLAQAIGPLGMAGGQAIDLEATQRPVDEDHLETMHLLKTGALIRAAVRLGALAANADEAAQAALDDYARTLGLAFQVRDDMLDVQGSTESLGKTAGTDAAHDKQTYVALLGLEAAAQRLDVLRTDAHAALSQLTANPARLHQLADYICRRDV